jgi:asparagine synthase (glutamine-hydrolysing)
VNGEFYDHERIRADLKAKGHIFKTLSDSEIVIHLYTEYGLDFITHLRGEFSFVLYDENTDRLIAVRDRFGIKPLCFTHNDEGLFIASEAKALFEMGIQAQWNDYAFLHACNLQYVPADRSLFKGVSQLPPGHMLMFDGQNLNIKKYWDLDFPQEPIIAQKSEAEYIEEFRDLFQESVRLRLRTDVPLCAHLSGGLDSSAIAATAMKIQGRPLDCFTVSFAHEGYDELPVAQEMADHLGAPLHVVNVSQDDLVSTISDAVYYSEGLAINGHLAGKYMLNKAIKNAGFSVALSGEGADEALAGYPHLREDLIMSGNGLNAVGANDKLKSLYQSNNKLAGVFLAHGDQLPLNSITQALGYVPSFLNAKASLGYRATSLLSDEYVCETDFFKDMIHSFDIKGQLKGRHLVNQSSYLWTKLTLANYILRTLGDGCEMAYSIEGRVPFLDHHLFEYVRSLPMNMKIKGMSEKYILREALKPLVTKTIYERQKHPFIAPPVSRFSNAKLDNYIQDTLRSTDFKAMDFWDQKKVLAWLDQIPKMDAQDQAAAEPALMMILTSYLIQQRFNLKGEYSHDHSTAYAR